MGPEKGGRDFELFLFGDSKSSLLPNISIPGLLSSRIGSEGKEEGPMPDPVFPKSTMRSEKIGVSGRFSCTAGSS